jgi:hypothetical protein
MMLDSMLRRNIIVFTLFSFPTSGSAHEFFEQDGDCLARDFSRDCERMRGFFQEQEKDNRRGRVPGSGRLYRGLADAAVTAPGWPLQGVG